MTKSKDYRLLSHVDEYRRLPSLDAEASAQQLRLLDDVEEDLRRSRGFAPGSTKYFVSSPVHARTEHSHRYLQDPSHDRRPDNLVLSFEVLMEDKIKVNGFEQVVRHVRPLSNKDKRHPQAKLRHPMRMERKLSSREKGPQYHSMSHW
jgi:hypothetical protein